MNIAQMSFWIEPNFEFLDIEPDSLKELLELSRQHVVFMRTRIEMFDLSAAFLELLHLFRQVFPMLLFRRLRFVLFVIKVLSPIGSRTTGR